MSTVHDLIPFRREYYGACAAATLARRVLTNAGRPQAIHLRDATKGHAIRATYWVVLTCAIDGKPSVRWANGPTDDVGQHAALTTHEYGRRPAETMAQVAAIVAATLTGVALEAGKGWPLSVDPDPCRDCHGTGETGRKDRSGDPESCPACGGTGWQDD